MPRVIPVEELQRIVEMVAPHRDGVGVDAIRRRLGPGLSDRTLQRRLSLLSREGRITAEGTGKNTTCRNYRDRLRTFRRSSGVRGIESVDPSVALRAWVLVPIAQAHRDYARTRWRAG